MSARRDAFGHYLDAMAARGFRPSRRLGQNFLLDPSLHRAIADAGELDREAVVLEIGTGLGFLTRELACRARAVVTVEVDERLAAIVADELDGWQDGARVHLVRADALDGDAIAAPVRAAVGTEAGDSGVTVVANLPYAAAGRFLAVALTQSEIRIARIAAVVQLELAERLAAAPGSRSYGGPSVLAQAWGRVELLRRIGREVFRPRPRVDSALVRITAGRERLPPGFGPFVRGVFGGRRKTLRHAIERLHPDAAPEIVASWGGRRAEELAPGELLALHAALGG